jgi:hypothetical protein
MPTAILRYFTSSGFIIAADGKTCNSLTGDVLSTDTQKIFQIPGLPAAYVLYGDIGIGDDDPHTPLILDLAVEMKRILGSRTDAKPPSDLQSYGDDLAAEMQELLSASKAKGAVFHGKQEYADGITIARILLFGYVDGIPSEVNILFFHREQRLVRQKVYPVDLRRSNPEVMGSLVIEQRLFRQPQSEDVSLLRAAQEVEHYIQVCDSEEGRAADSVCLSIGGHIHVAMITPSCFHWLKPPLLRRDHV